MDDAGTHPSPVLAATGCLGPNAPVRLGVFPAAREEGQLERAPSVNRRRVSKIELTAAASGSRLWV